MSGKATFTPVLQHFRWYEDDNTEAASTPVSGAGEDANISVSALTTWRQLQLRVLIQETGGADAGAGTTWKLTWSNDNSTWAFALGYTSNSLYGPYAGEEAGTLIPATYETSPLTNGSATTNRATNGLTDPGAGSFIAGSQVTTVGTAGASTLTANNFTELVFAIRVPYELFVTNPSSVATTWYFAIEYSGTAIAMTNQPIITATVTTATKALTSSAYRFYGNGTESGSTALGSQDTATDIDISGGDVQFQLRHRLANASGNGAMICQLYPVIWEYRIDAGSWTAVDATTTAIRFDSGSSLTDQGTTTERLTGGSGTFQAGTQRKVYLNSDTEQWLDTGTAYQENVWGFKVIAASFSGGETVQFRAYQATSQPNTAWSITDSVTPTLNIVAGATTHPLASSNGVAQADGTATGKRALALAESSGVAQLDGTATGGAIRPFAASAGVAQVDATATGSRASALASTAGAAQLDADTAGSTTYGLAASTSSQLDATATGSVVHPTYALASTAGVAQLDGAADGSKTAVLAASSGVAQVDGAALGVSTLGLAATSAAQVDGAATGTSALSLAATAAAQVDGAASGAALHPLDSTGGVAQLDGTATGAALRLHQLASTAGVAQVDGAASGASTRALAGSGAAQLDGTATGASLRPLAASAAAQLDGTATGTRVAPLAASSGTAQLDGTGSGEVVPGGVTHPLAASSGVAQADGAATGTATRPLAATSASRLDGAASGVSDLALASSAGVARLDGTATGESSGIAQLASTAGVAQVDGAASGVSSLSLDATASAQVDGTAAGVSLLSLASTAGSIRLDGTASGARVLALAASMSVQADATASGSRVAGLAASAAAQADATASGSVALGLAATSTIRLDGTASGVRMLDLASALAAARLDASASGSVLLSGLPTLPLSAHVSSKTYDGVVRSLTYSATIGQSVYHALIEED